MTDRRAPPMQHEGRTTIYTLPRLCDRRVVDLRERELRAWESMLLIKRMYP